MKSTKLHNVLSRMTRDQVKRFRDFLRSPYFNKNAQMETFLAFWEKHYSDPAQAPDWDRETQMKKYARKKPMSAKQFQKLKTSLLNLLFQFLAHERLDMEPHLQNLLEVKALNQLKAGKTLESRIGRAKKQLSEDPGEEGEKYFKRMELEQEENRHFNAAARRPKQTNLGLIAENLEYGFLTNAIRLRFAMHNAKQILNEETPWEFMDQIWPQLLMQEGRFPPILRMYIHLYGLFDADREAYHYLALSQILAAESKQVSKSELRSIYTGALNHCARKVNQGEQGFLQEYLKLSKAMIAENILCDENGRLSPWPFKNLITIALRLGEFEWVTDFMQSHQKFIDPALRQDAIRYNTGALHFFKQDYDQAQSAFLRLLQECEDIFYHLDARTYLLRIYYEIGDGQAMESLVHAFRMYIQRTKHISPTYKDLYLTFIRFFRRLINLPPRNAARIALLKEDLSNSGLGRAGKEWILEKLRELE